MTNRRCDNSIDPGAARAALQHLCQPAQVARLLRAVAGERGVEKPRIEEVRVERCWPGRDGAYVFEWSFAVDGRRRRVYGRCVPHDEADADDGGDAYPQRGDPKLWQGVRSWQPRWHTTVFSCDRDPRLRHLPACLDPREAAAVAGLFPRGTVLKEAHLLAYKPGRRATVHYELRSRAGTRRRGTPNAVGKTFRDQRGLRILTLHEQVRSELRRTGATVTVPAPLGYIEALRLAVVEWIEVDPRAVRALATSDYVAALADLHRIDVDDLPQHSTHDECALVRQWHEYLQVIRPTDADRAWPLVEELCRRVPEVADAEACVIHRDFYERQLLPGMAGPVVIDLDTLSRGDRCVDLGNFAAHLALSRLAAGRRVRAATLCRQIVDLYEAFGQPVDRSDLEYYVACSLFRVAAVHAMRTATRRCSRPLVRLAADLMAIKLRSPVGALT